MSAVATPISLAALTPPPKPIAEDVSVGKDILELLAGSMYIDPLNIYREYIQNAADAIDEARDNNLSFDEPAGVRITFDHVERSVRIRDNGVSIPASDFVRRLITIGSSQKRGKKMRGFRGVGRLSGLGYCQELIFRGRAEGDTKISEIRWDGRALREKMRDPNYTGNLSKIVQDIVTETKLSGTGYPGRFFEVEMRKITRSRNDILLNEEVVRSYISQTAPVAFGNDFVFAREIDLKLQQYGIRPPIQVELEDGRGPIYHRVHDQFKLSESVMDTIRGVDFVEIMGSDGEICAIGWIADHSYSGSIPKRLGLGGIRLRVGNIQVGDESILAPLFPESRFAGWAIGDVHVISTKIPPNGRRDDFEPTPSYAHLQNELSIQARSITHKIRHRSSQRNQLRSMETHCGTIDTLVRAMQRRPIPRILIGVMHDLSVECLQRAEKEGARFAPGSKELELASTRLDHVREQVGTLSSAASSGKRSESRLRPEWVTPVSTALKTIMSAAKTVDAGVDLSIQVLVALEQTLSPVTT